MPISCPLDVRPLSAAEFQYLDYRIMGHAYDSQNELGRLCEEGIYQRDLQARLLSDGFQSVQVEVQIAVSHAEFTKVFSLDLVADNAVYELKTTATLNAKHQAQLLNYLFLLNVPRGKLITFRSSKVQGQLHASSVTLDDRHRFQVNTDRWMPLTDSCDMLCHSMQNLLADWGAYLDCRLYEQALTHFCGGESMVVQRLSLSRDSNTLGTQRFHVHSPGFAFRVTATTSRTQDLEMQLRRLLSLTSLQALQWINLNHSHIHFITLQQ